MKRQDYLILFFAALVFTSAVAFFQHSPGYMDADYYYAGGLRLAGGHGFTETYLWNYLDDPQELPHPSHGYWFPLASLLAAGGMALTGSQTFVAARLAFLLLTALTAPLTAALAYSFNPNRSLALTSGWLAIFAGYYTPYLPTTDNFSIYTVLGALFFLLITRRSARHALLLGLTAGLMNLARSDGLLWLAVGAGGIFFHWRREKSPFFSAFLAPLLLLGLGYALVMTPWFLRNLSIWNTPLTPAGSRVLWMTAYEDTFAYPPDRIDRERWLSAGWQVIAAGRAGALRLNLINSVAAQGAFLMAILIPIGLWRLRSHMRARLAVLAWLSLFFVMTFIFPFAGSRGSFFHASAALQPMGWVAAPVAVQGFISHARRRGLAKNPSALPFALFSLVSALFIITLALVYLGVLQADWDRFERLYTRAEQVLAQNGATPADVVIVANSPGYYAYTGRSAITVPDEPLPQLFALSARFGASYLILEEEYTPESLADVYEKPSEQPGLLFLGQVEDLLLFRLAP